MKKSLNRFLGTSLLCAVLFLTTFPANGAGKDLPEVLFAASSEAPVWVRADRAFTPSGEIALDVFPESVRAALSRYLALPQEGGCIYPDRHIETRRMVRAGREDLTSTTRDSDWVVRGRVTGKAGGFRSAEPGTLVEFVPVETLKGSERRQGPHYFFMPVGVVEAGQTKFCKDQGFYADLPEIGDEILLLVSLQGLTGDGLVYTDAESGIITLHSRGNSSLPKAYRSQKDSSDLVSNGDVLRRVRQLLQEMR
jgi:hypothetical protein